VIVNRWLEVVKVGWFWKWIWNNENSVRTPYSAACC